MNTGRLINRLSNCLRRRSQAIQRSIGVSGAQGAILDYVLVESASGEVCQRDIEREFGLRPSTATEMLQSMEEGGLIRREPSANDARRKNIVFTPQADRVRDALKAEITGTEALLLRGITPEEQALFAAICVKMLNNLNGAGI